jgi:hypothetical protein
MPFWFEHNVFFMGMQAYHFEEIVLNHTQASAIGGDYSTKELASQHIDIRNLYNIRRGIHPFTWQPTVHRLTQRGEERRASAIIK